MSHPLSYYASPPFNSYLHPFHTMPPKQRHYSILSPPRLSMSELVKTTLDHDSTDLLIDKWLDHRNIGHDTYHEWFKDVRERRHKDVTKLAEKQVIAWNKGPFAPENVFCRTVDTGRLIPLDRTWTTHVYHHHAMQERRLSMMRVVFTMVSLHPCSATRSHSTSFIVVARVNAPSRDA